MILDGVAPASTTMAATLGMVASVAIAEVAEQGSWGAIRLIWMRLDRAGDSDRGRAPQTGMRVAADVTLHPLAIAPVATTGSATGRPSVHPINCRTTASPDMATEARTIASGRASATAPGANERRIGSATVARAPTLLAEQSASSAHSSTRRRPCARPQLATVDTFIQRPQLTRVFHVLDNRCGAPKSVGARPYPAAPNDGAERPVLIVKGLVDATGEGALFDVFTTFGQVREIRLVRTKGDLTSRGFAFVEFHSLAAARAVLAAAEPIVVDGVAVRVSFAREPKTSSSGGSSHQAPGGAEQLPEVARERYGERYGESHQGPKRSGFGIPSGFVPDQASGYYFSAATGYYYDATTKLYYHPTTTLW